MKSQLIIFDDDAADRFTKNEILFQVQTIKLQNKALTE